MRLLSTTFILIIFTVLASCVRPTPETPSEPNSELLLSRFEGIEKLAVAGMSIKKTASINDISMSEAEGSRQIIAAVVDALKIGDRKAVYSYDTYLNAYIDMSELTAEDITVDKEARRISVRLPAIKTEFSGREAEFHEEHYRVTGLRSVIGPEERARLKEQMNTLLKQEVKSNPEFAALVTEAGRRRAESFFRQLLASDGYKVEVSWK
ncbi:MAG: DUF4230 domain-containing protein [Bacteroidales bacterium]|nr:DUF4230 domain-containing protein [Bacteroidales bacterium]